MILSIEIKLNLHLKIMFRMTYTKQTYNIKSPKPYLFIGSKMRGILGYALKEEVCINPTLKCEGCFAASECVFYEMYEKQNVTHTYRLDFKLVSNKYKFSLLLFNDLQKYSADIQSAMTKALHMYKDVEVKSKEKKFKVKKPVSSVLKLTFITPLRIKKQNIFARKDIDLVDILRSIYKRDRDFNAKPHQALEIEENFTEVSKNLHYEELIRKSNKQQRKMNMGGLMGEMVISGVNEEVYKLLKLGEIIGVGKSTVFGLGKIKIEEIV